MATKKTAERSSYEFAVALMVGTITTFIPGWIAYLISGIAMAGATVYFCFVYGQSAGYKTRKKLVISFFCVVFLGSLVVPQIRTRYRDENVIPPTNRYITTWGNTLVTIDGTPPHVVGGVPSAVVTVDGKLLSKYKKRFDLMGVLLHVMNGESYMDKPDICRSKILRIRDENITVKIDYNQTFLNEMQLGASSVTYVLLAVPKGIKPEGFQTLNEAEDRGVQVIDETGSTSLVAQTMPTK